MPKKIKCKVCGTKHIPIRQRTTIERHGPFNANDFYDVMDCPNCGCEILLSKRIEFISSKNESEADA